VKTGKNWWANQCLVIHQYNDGIRYFIMAGIFRPDAFDLTPGEVNYSMLRPAFSGVPQLLRDTEVLQVDSSQRTDRFEDFHIDI
jgi:hypothetical protein